jgi:PqqD family protein of HPr-rel-A system
VTDGASLFSLSAGRFAVRTWQDRAVCYDAASGDTVFLDELGTVILDVLGAGPATLDALISRLGERFTVEQELADLAGQALARLSALGFISEAPA